MKIKYILILYFFPVNKILFCSNNSFSNFKIREFSINPFRFITEETDKNNKKTIFKEIKKENSTYKESYEKSEGDTILPTKEDHPETTNSPSEDTKYSPESSDSESDILTPMYTAPQKKFREKKYTLALSKNHTENNLYTDTIPDSGTYYFKNKIFRNYLRRERPEEKKRTLSYKIPDSREITDNLKYQESLPSQFSSINLFKALEQSKSSYPTVFSHLLNISFSNPNKNNEDSKIKRAKKKFITIIESENGEKKEIKVIQIAKNQKIFKKIDNKEHLKNTEDTALKNFFISKKINNKQ